MALKRRIGKTQSVPFQITSVAATQIVVIASGKESGTIYQRFSYPQRGDSNDTQDSSNEEEWELLDVDSTGTIYSGIIEEDATRDAEDDILVVDIKAWDAEGKTRVKRIEVLPLVSTAVENITPLP